MTTKGERREMSHPVRLDGRKRRGSRIAKLSAVFAALLFAVVLAACGSSSSSSSSGASGSSGGTGTNASSSGSAGVTKATANLQQWKAAPTKINVTTPLTSKPSGSKTLVMLATNNPSNVELQQSLKQL